MCKPMWVNEACQLFLVPSRSSNMPLYPSKCCELGSTPWLLPILLSCTWTHFWVLQGVESASLYPRNVASHGQYPNSLSFCYFHLGLTFKFIKEFGGVLVSVLGWSLSDDIDVLLQGALQLGNGTCVATELAHESSNNAGQVANVWSWPKSKKGQHQMKLLTMVKVFIGSSLQGALNDGQGGSRLKLDQRSLRLAKPYWVGVLKTCWWCLRFLPIMT